MGWSSDDLKEKPIEPQQRTNLERVRTIFSAKLGNPDIDVNFVPGNVGGEGMYEVLVPRNWTRDNLKRLGFKSPKTEFKAEPRSGTRIAVIPEEAINLPNDVNTLASATQYVRQHFNDQEMECTQLHARGADPYTDYVHVRMDLMKYQMVSQLGLQEGDVEFKIDKPNVAASRRAILIPEKAMHETLGIHVDGPRK